VKAMNELHDFMSEVCKNNLGVGESTAAPRNNDRRCKFD
jgi:hypothetical protein